MHILLCIHSPPVQHQHSATHKASTYEASSKNGIFTSSALDSATGCFWDIHKQTFFLSSNINTNYSKECLPMRHESMSKRHFIAGKEILAHSNVSYVIFIRRLNIKSIQLSSHVRQDYERFARLLMLRFSPPASRNNERGKNSRQELLKAGKRDWI